MACFETMKQVWLGLFLARFETQTEEKQDCGDADIVLYSYSLRNVRTGWSHIDHILYMFAVHVSRAPVSGELELTERHE